MQAYAQFLTLLMAVLSLFISVFVSLQHLLLGIWTLGSTVEVLSKQTFCAPNHVWIWYECLKLPLLTWNWAEIQLALSELWLFWVGSETGEQVGFRGFCVTSLAVEFSRKVKCCITECAKTESSEAKKLGKNKRGVGGVTVNKSKTINTLAE